MEQQSGWNAGWNESDSRDFIDLGRFFVPDREEQIATVLDMVPDPGEGLLVDLCCGEGLLSRALLERFPKARVLAMDLSPAMLEKARVSLAEHGDRFSTRPFDLADRSWRSFPEPVRAFVSSLAVHHLDGGGKRDLFRDLAAALAPGGALVIADLVRPATPAAQALAARLTTLRADPAATLDEYRAGCVTVGHDDDRLAHFLVADQAVQALG